MIYNVYTNALYKSEDSLPSDGIHLKERYVKSVAESTNTSWDVPRQRFPPSAAPLEPRRRVVCGVLSELQQIHIGQL